MAEVIRIEDRLLRRSPKSRRSAAALGEAVVLFFTGIRYERLDGTPVKDPLKPLRGTSQNN